MRDRKKSRERVLRLRRESLRLLDRHELDQVIGGRQLKLDVVFKDQRCGSRYCPE